MSERLDIVLFGATGYTGKYCMKYLNHLTNLNGRALTWGIAGRSREKLNDTVREYQKENGDNLISEVPIIIADVMDNNSLLQMTSQARVVINCCGPYRFYGEPVVKACLETNTHYVDVTGEPEFMELTQLKYHKAAQEKGVYIVSGCGFDSIPADLGVVHLQKNFEGTLNSVEMYMQLYQNPPIVSGSSVNYATWESLIHGVANSEELLKIRAQLFSKRLPKVTPKLEAKSSVHKSEIIDGWAVPFIGSDRSVIQRTQRYLYEHEQIRPVQVQTYLGVPTNLALLKMVFYKFLVQYFIKSEYGRKVLLQHPKLFSNGFFSHQSPSKEKMENLQIRLTFMGKGWNKNVDYECDEPPNKIVICSLECANPMYGIAALAVTLSAIVILTEPQHLPKSGGVYTPGAVFGNTSLFQQLQQNGVGYHIKSKL